MSYLTKLLMSCLLGFMMTLSLGSVVYADEGNIGDVKYINGGFGEEADEFKASAKDYNLRLYLSEGKGSHFVTNAAVSITDKKGNVRLSLADGGPLLFVQLERGSYTIKAEYNDVTITRNVAITSARGANVYLNWKSEEAEDLPAESKSGDSEQENIGQ